jgi:hypothetical protein
MGPSEPFGRGQPSVESGPRSSSGAAAKNGEVECTSEGADCAQGLGDEPEGGYSITQELQQFDLAADLDQVPTPRTHYFFMDRDSTDPILDNKIASMENDGDEPKSITCFLTLPTIMQQCNPRTKDPTVDFLKSVILTSDQYIAAATQMQQTREEALREKERNKLEKEETRKRKANEKEEAAAARALTREEVHRLK